MQLRSPQRLSEELRQLSYVSRREGATFGDLFLALSARGHALIALFFCLPFFIPIPVPGMSMVLGPVIVLIGIMLMLNRPPWLPKRVLRLRCDKRMITKGLRVASRVMVRMERRLVRPRGKFLFRLSWIARVNGFVMIACGVLLALPLPPGTNWPPAFGCVLLCIGILEDDGLFVMLGYLVTAVTALLFAAGMFFGLEGLLHLYRDWV
jgi:hypothetical protein